MLEQVQELVSLARAQEARELLASALRQDPGNHDFRLMQANMALDSGEAQASGHLCAQLRRAGNRSGWLMALEGRIALLAGDLGTARERARQAAVAGAPDAFVAGQIGVLLSHTGLHSAAEKFLGFAASACPQRANDQFNHATVLQYLGDIEGAEGAFRAALNADPAHARAWAGLARIATASDPAWLSQIESLFDRSQNSDEQLMLGHALSRLLELEGEWDLALAWLDRAKRAKAREAGYRKERSQAVFDAVCAAAGVGPISLKPIGDERPVFIVGMPRSGTTLVDRILDSHHAMTSRGELADFGHALAQRLGLDTRNVVDKELADRAGAAANLLPVGNAYLQSVAPRSGGPARIIDKRPHNFLLVPAILRALPGARVICLRRSPFDTLFGNYREQFAPDAEDFFYNLDLADTAHFVAGFEQCANHFARVLPAERFLMVQYEQVVADLAPQARRMVDFCGLEWDEACIAFHTNPRPVATASSAQVRQPVNTASIGRWRRYAKGSQRAITEFARYGIVPDVGG